MPFENNNNTEQIKIDPSKQQEQIDRDFEDILKEYQNMSHEEQGEFIEAVANKDPHFKKLQNELKSYFWSQIERVDNKQKNEVVENQEDTIKSDTNLENNSIQEDKQITKQIEVETITSNELIETQKGFFETNNDFASFNDLMTEKTINGNPVMVLDDNVYDALLRYKDNREPLIKALAYKELNQANSELKASKKTISTSMQYKPENIDKAYKYSYEQFETKQDKILEDFKSIAEDFKELMKTDAGKLIISNTAFTSFENKLKTDINTQLGYEENTENETTLNIENNTKELLLNLGVIENKFHDKIQDFLANQDHLKANDYISWQKILYTDFPNQLEKNISEEIRLYSKKVGEDLIKSNAGIIKELGTFNLPIGNGENVRLDFSELGDISSLDNSKIIELYNSNFDSIYRNDIGEKISDTISDIWKSMKENPGKTTIDITSIIFAGIGAVLVSEGTGTITAPLIAGPTFTVIDNGYRAGMYEAFNIEGGWEAGVGIEENDTHNDILRKKLFELSGNTVLFGMFKVTGLLEKKYLPQIDSQLKSMTIKTPVEASFFTYYSVVSENLQDTVKNDGNTNELLNDFSEMPNFDILMKSYIYNLGFITAVKAGAIPAEKMVIAGYQKQLNKEELNLKNQNIVILNTGNGYAFYKGNTKLEGNDLKGFEKFIALNKKINYIAMEQYKKPESGRGGKAAYSTTFREQKFQNLEKYSKEAQSGKIDYALNDKVIGKTLTNNGIQGGKGVGEGLLKKSGFDKIEINDFKEGKLKGEKIGEKRALKEMEKASEVIFKEFSDIKKNVYIGLKKGLPRNEILKDYPSNTRDKITFLINKSL